MRSYICHIQGSPPPLPLSEVIPAPNCACSAFGLLSYGVGCHRRMVGLIANARWKIVSPFREKSSAFSVDNSILQILLQIHRQNENRRTFRRLPVVGESLPASQARRPNPRTRSPHTRLERVCLPGLTIDTRWHHSCLTSWHGGHAKQICRRDPQRLEQGAVIYDRTRRE